LTRDPAKHRNADAAYFKALQAETSQALTSFARSTRPRLRDALLREQTSALVQAGAAGVPRTGLFLLPGVLSSVSNIDHTDIPRRGRFLLKQLFCEAVPSPPANLVQTLPPLPPGTSERDRFEKIEREPSCRGCHLRVDGLGYALEPFDEMGVARLTDEHGNTLRADGSHLVMAHGELVFKDTKDLFEQAATHPAVQRCVVLQSFRHFARREERGTQDACLLRDLVAGARATDTSFIDLWTDTLVRTALAPRGD
jgi:hypothetical protein